MTNGKIHTHHAFEALNADNANQLENSLWWIQGRKHIIRKHLQTIASRSGKLQNIMDIGCGSGGNLDLLAECGSVVGVEPSGVLAERSRAKGVASEIHDSQIWDVGTLHSFQLQRFQYQIVT